MKHGYQITPYDIIDKKELEQQKNENRHLPALFVEQIEQGF
jgi:hypothetical protein